MLAVRLGTMASSSIRECGETLASGLADSRSFARSRRRSASGAWLTPHNALGWGRGVFFLPPDWKCANRSDVATKHSGPKQAGESASQLISKRIAELDDWRGETLGRIRALIKEADPDILEEWKWMGTPVWSHDGIVCTGETYKSVVKMTFAKGASLKDPSRLFNSSLDGNVRRAIDIREGEKIDTRALKTLIRAAVALNAAGKKKKAAPAKRKAR